MSKKKVACPECRAVAFADLGGDRYIPIGKCAKCGFVCSLDFVFGWNAALEKVESAPSASTNPGHAAIAPVLTQIERDLLARDIETALKRVRGLQQQQ